VTEINRTNGLPKRRTSWTAFELLAADLPEPRCAVAGLFTEGLAFMCGAPKLGKSWLGLGLGISVAAGVHALGTVEVAQGDVLYLALEDNARRLQGRLRLLLNGDRAPKGLYLETEWPRLDQGGLEQLGEWLDDHPGARLLIVDVYPRIRPVVRHNTDRYQADYEAAALLQALAVKYEVAIVALYHTRKAEASDFVETVQGTFGTAAAADTIVVVKRARGQADATLYVTGRDVLEQELALRFAPEAGTWALLGDAAEHALGETRRQILDAVRAHSELTPKQVSELSSVDYELAKKTMQRMFADGQLIANNGSYVLPRSPVPAVPMSPDQKDSRTEGQRGHPSREEQLDLSTELPAGVREHDDEEIEPVTLGDRDYLAYLAAFHRAGHITTGEALELKQIHDLVLETGGERP
jgi:hypothetical protein